MLDRKSKTTTCCARVPKGTDGWRTTYSQCTRQGKVERDGKWYCGQHDPQAREYRYQKKREQWKVEAAEEERQRRMAIAAPDLLAALEAVVSVADRKTVEFDQARAAIAKAKGLQNVEA